MNEACENFDHLVSEFFPVWLRYNPQLAYACGFHDFNHQLPPVDDDEIGALEHWLENALSVMQSIDDSALDEDRQLDFSLLYGACQNQHARLLQQDWRHRDPLPYLLAIAPPPDALDTDDDALTALLFYYHEITGFLRTRT